MSGADFEASFRERLLADEVNDQASGNGLLPGVLLPVKKIHFLCYFFRYGFAERPLQDLVVFQKNFFGETLRAEADKQKEKGCLLYKQKEPDPGGSATSFIEAALWCIRFSGLQKCFLCEACPEGAV